MDRWEPEEGGSGCVRGGAGCRLGDRVTTEKLTMLIISGVVVLGFGSVLLAWMAFPPKDQSQLLAGLTGALAAGYLQVINYWFTKTKD